MKPIDHLVSVFGSQANVGRAVGVKRSAVNNWVKTGIIPVQRRLQVIEAARRMKLRIDVELVLGRELSRGFRRLAAAKPGIKPRAKAA